MSIRLRDLINSWIQDDPVLREHISLSYFVDGFFIETTCGGPFTVAWIDENGQESTPNIWDVQNCKSVKLNPADPEYFNKLGKSIRNWHNTYRNYEYGCQEKL